MYFLTLKQFYLPTLESYKSSFLERKMFEKGIQHRLADSDDVEESNRPPAYALVAQSTYMPVHACTSPPFKCSQHSLCSR